MKKRFTLKQRFLYGFFTFVIVIASLFLFYSFLTYRSILRYEQEKIELYLKFASSNILREIKNIISEALKLSNSYEVKAALLNEKKAFFNEESREFKIVLWDRDNREIARYPYNWKASLEIDAVYSAFSKAERNKEVIIEDVHIDNSSYILLTDPVFDKGVLIGFFSIFLDMSKREFDIFNSVFDPDVFEWEIILTNRKGSLLFHSHKKIDFSDISDRDYSLYPPVRDALLGRTGLYTTKIHNAQWYTLSEVIPVSRWLLVVSVPQKLILKKVLKVISPPFLILIVLIVLILILAWIWANSLVSSFLFLTKAFKEYGEKGERINVEYTGYQEIEDAIKQFNEMIEERTRLDQEFLDIIERDRRSIGVSLHEELEKNLSKIYQVVLILKEELSKILSKENSFIYSYLDKMSVLLDKTTTSTSLIANGLSPAMRDKDLLRVLQESAEEFEKTYHIKVIFNLNGNTAMKDEKLKLIIYYIVNEAIHIAKEKNPTLIAITMNREINYIVIRIKDNSKDNKKEKEESSLRLLYYFARLIGASINIERKSGENQISIKILINNITEV